MWQSPHRRRYITYSDRTNSEYVTHVDKLILFCNYVRLLNYGFSKAFDMVPHNSLLVKLSGYSIQDKTLDWIGSFLSDRSQRVVVEGEQSNPAPVTSGVPQGSVPGPILFLVFINDLPKAIDSSCRLFADDTIVYREISFPTDSAALQHDLEAL